LILTDDPKPRVGLALRPPPRWSPRISKYEDLGFSNSSTASFAAVLESRCSQRVLGPLSREQLGTLLWHAARVRSINGFREHRASPSGGALHPIHIVVFDAPFTSAVLYDPLHHRLGHIAEIDAADLSRRCASLGIVLPDARGSFLLAVAEFGRTAALYENADSVVWRDAGCLLSTLHLTATWLGLGSCLMGLVGADLAPVLAPDGQVRPVGLLAVGTSQ
jgi:SagB-type dehydrogenase family enzyme